MIDTIYYRYTVSNYIVFPVSEVVFKSKLTNMKSFILIFNLYLSVKSLAEVFVSGSEPALPGWSRYKLKAPHKKSVFKRIRHENASVH